MQDMTVDVDQKKRRTVNKERQHDEEGREAGSGNEDGKETCKEIPVGQRDAAAIPVQETSV